MNPSENKLVERILSEAREQAALTESKARDDIAEINAEYKHKRMAAEAIAATRLKNSVESVIDGALTRAAIEGKKYALSVKRQLIDSAFENAYNCIVSSDTDIKASLLYSLIMHETVKGETVVPAASDREILDHLLNNEFSDRELTLSEENAPIDHGFIVQGSGFDKDCSLTSVLNNVRESEETHVAQLLFS